ncbi:MAG: NADH-quinone oxidoreductase subunit N, partial [Candidatus Acidiferrales bacterium]
MTGMTVSLAAQIANLQRVAPEVVLCVFGIVIMLVDPFIKPAGRRVLGWIAFVGMLVAIASIYVAARHEGFAYSRLISTDNFSLFVHVVVIGAAALAILGSIDYLDREDIQRGEFYALVLFATAGMGILAASNELITAFIGLEISSISSYILCGFRRKARESNEAAMKYFLLGSFATAFFLYGIAMIYGSTGTTYIDSARTELERQIAVAGHIPMLAILGLGL